MWGRTAYTDVTFSIKLWCIHTHMHIAASYSHTGIFHCSLLYNIGDTRPSGTFTHNSALSSRSLPIGKPGAFLMHDKMGSAAGCTFHHCSIFYATIRTTYDLCTLTIIYIPLNNKGSIQGEHQVTWQSDRLTTCTWSWDGQWYMSYSSHDTPCGKRIVANTCWADLHIPGHPAQRPTKPWHLKKAIWPHDP